MKYVLICLLVIWLIAIIIYVCDNVLGRDDDYDD